MNAIDSQEAAAQPRAVGHVHVSFKNTPGGSALSDLRQSGSMRALFPRSGKVPTTMLLNTAGGVTGGDRFDTRIDAGPGASVTVTTQAAERAYAAQPGSTGNVRNSLSVAPDARINWVPQETILFDKSALSRRLDVSLTGNGEALLVEPLVFGRPAHGEVLRSVAFRDRVRLRRDDKIIHADGIDLDGDTFAAMQRRARGDGAGAMATMVFASPRVEAVFEPLQDFCAPARAGVSCLGPDLLVCRILARDGFGLRRVLMPILDFMTGQNLPICWRL